MNAFPLYGPWAMTIAPNGDLYVANENANQILVYGSNLVQKTGNTITAGLSAPTGVAFDSLGELYVGNIDSNQITVYNANRTYLPTRTLMSNVYRPISIAIDGLDNLLVDNNFIQGIATFSFGGVYQGNIVANGGTVDSLAARSRFDAFGTPTSAAFASSAGEIEALRGGQVAGLEYIPANSARGVAFDGKENLYYVSDDHIVGLINTTAGLILGTLINLPFEPQAIAVDSTHNHIFVSDFADSTIAVYTLTGTLITTLH